LREKDYAEVVPDPAAALARAVQRGTLLQASPPSKTSADRKESETLYFLNSPRGRAAAQAFSQGSWQPGASASPPPARPNIYKLYEDNIGPLTPLLADALKDAEQTYSPEWIEAALSEAVLNNKRSWKYVDAILRRWKDEGHAKEQNRRDPEGLHGRDVTRKVEDFLKR
jgi:DnaD/phage-associated family protein